MLCDDHAIGGIMDSMVEKKKLLYYVINYTFVKNAIGTVISKTCH